MWEKRLALVRPTKIRTLRPGPEIRVGPQPLKEFTSRGNESLPSCGVFSLAAAHPESAKKLYARTTDLFQQLNRWRSAKAASRPLPEPLAKLETPQLREVTSQSPERCLRAKNFFGTIPNVLLAAMTAALFGLPFHLGAFLTGMLAPVRVHFSPPAQVGTWWPAPSVIRCSKCAPCFLQGPTGNEPCAKFQRERSSCQDGAAGGGQAHNNATLVGEKKIN